MRADDTNSIKRNARGSYDSVSFSELIWPPSRNNATAYAQPNSGQDFDEGMAGEKKSRPKDQPGEN
jgi:hypothetical protein